MKKNDTKIITITSTRVDVSDLDYDEFEDIDYDDYESGPEIEKRKMTKKQFLSYVKSLKKDDDIDVLTFNWKEARIYFRFIKTV